MWLNTFTTNPPSNRKVVYILPIILINIQVISCVPDPHCKACKDFIETFRKGYENTEGSNFGGGNTDWEETRLGSYATSETRLVEIMEHVCTDGSKDMCHQFVEAHEEQIEKWYFHLQNHYQDFETWLCMNTAKVCCPANTYGPDCKSCAGVVPEVGPCMGRGYCEGNGTRKGSGKCRCHKGYIGNLCDTCGIGYFQNEKNDTFVECIDIDECSDPNICSASEYCFNTEGSYKCTHCHTACKGCTGAGAAKCKECKEGYISVNGTCTDETDADQDEFSKFNLRPIKKSDDDSESPSPSLSTDLPRSEL